MQVQFPEYLQRFSNKTGVEGELAQRQKNAVYQNGIFESPDENDKFSLYYELYGQGPVKIIFIQGFGGDMDLYRRILIPMLEHPEIQICLYNNRGIYPSTTDKRNSMTIAMMAHDAYLLIRHLGWPKVNISAASMGGMIALEFASTYPEVTESLNVNCGTAGPFRPSAHAAKEFAKQAFSSNLKKIRESNAKLMHSELFLNQKHPQYNNMTGLEFTCQDDSQNPYPCTSQPVSILMQQFRAILKHKVSKERLQEIKKHGFPCLISHGTVDQIIPYENGVFIAQNTGGTLIPYENAGHNMFFEQPEKMINIGLNFFMKRPLSVEHYPGIAIFDGISSKAEVKSSENQDSNENQEKENVNQQQEEKASEIEKEKEQMSQQEIEPDQQIETTKNDETTKDPIESPNQESFDIEKENINKEESVQDNYENEKQVEI